MEKPILTRFLVLSDTHTDKLQTMPEAGLTDVLIHCGDITEQSKLAEFKTMIEYLQEFDAPLKLIIAGNHDFTLDTPMFRKKAAGYQTEMDLIRRNYGGFGEARALFESENAKAAGIVFLEEGSHQFELANGASLKVFASPYTPSTNEWAFQYDPQEGHNWQQIPDDTDVVITHGPPKGIMDYTSSHERAGDKDLFARIAHVQPKMHCFGHIHESWGAKNITWREEISEKPTHFVDIKESKVIETLHTVECNRHDTIEMMRQKTLVLKGYKEKGYCSAGPPDQATQTLFINAAIEGKDVDSQHLPWVASLELARVSKSMKKRKVGGEDGGDMGVNKKRKTA